MQFPLKSVEVAAHAAAAILGLGGLGGVRTQVSVMVRLVALVVGGMEGIRGNKLLLAVALLVVYKPGIHTVAAGREVLGLGFVLLRNGGLAITACVLSLCRLEGVGTQIGIMIRLVALVVGGVIRVGGNILSLVLLILLVLAIRRAITDIGGVAVVDRAVYSAEAGLGRLCGVSAQVVVMVRLVTAVAGSVEAGRVLVLLAVDGIHRSGRLEGFLYPLVLGGYILAHAEGAGGLGVGSQIVVVAGLIAAVVGGMELLGLIHWWFLLLLVVQNSLLRFTHLRSLY